MSEKKFQEARSGLAFSQQLLDQMREGNMAQQSPEMVEEAPMEEEAVEQPMEEKVNVEEPVEEPQEENKEDKLIGVIETMAETDKIEAEAEKKEE